MCVLAYVQMNLLGIIILFFFWRNQRRSGSLALDDQLFNGLLLAAIAEQAMDAGQWVLDGVSFPGSYILQMLVYSLGYAIAPTITCLWTMYCDLRTNMDERGLKRRALPYVLPIFLNAGLLVANIFTPLVFSFDARQVYHREPYFLVYMVLMYLYGVLSFAIVLRRTQKPVSAADRSELRYMALFVIPPLIAGVLQWMFYGISIIWVSVLLSIILVYTNVLSRQISTDPLTGLNNRRKLSHYLDMKLNSAEADSDIFLIMLDADNFKNINDTYGHTAGDRALVAIAEILKTLCIGRDFFLARLGGDEFVIFGRHQGSLTPEAIAAQIEEQVRHFNETTAERFRLSLSVGWARFYPQETRTADALLSAADQQMYRVKAAKLVGVR